MRTTLAALIVALGLAAAAVGGVHLCRARSAASQATAATRPAAPAASNPAAALPLVPDDPKAARFLSAQGITTRFAIGTLGRDRAEQLFSHMFDKPASDGSAGPRVDHPAADAFWQRVATRGDREYRAIAASVRFGAAPLKKPNCKN